MRRSARLTGCTNAAKMLPKVSQKTTTTTKRHIAINHVSFACTHCATVSESLADSQNFSTKLPYNATTKVEIFCAHYGAFCEMAFCCFKFFLFLFLCRFFSHRSLTKLRADKDKLLSSYKRLRRAAFRQHKDATLCERFNVFNKFHHLMTKLILIEI